MLALEVFKTLNNLNISFMKIYLLFQSLQFIRNTISLYAPETQSDLRTKARKFWQLWHGTVCQKRPRHLQSLMNLRWYMQCFISSITKISLLKYCIHFDIQVFYNAWAKFSNLILSRRGYLDSILAEFV